MNYLIIFLIIQTLALFCKRVEGDLYSNTNYDDDDEFEDDANESEDENSFELNMDGSMVDRNPKELTAIFFNEFPDKLISLHWVGQAGEDVVIAEIEADSTANINTFAGHSFYAQTIEAVPQRAHPKIVVVKDGMSEYKVGPVHSTITTRSTNGKLHPAVKLINMRSTSVNVKFRSLAPAIDMWYDGGEGSVTFQGSLSLGQESTINTYEGHVFFFTVKGNKDKELARHTMAADKVFILIEDKDHPPSAEMLKHIEKESKYMAKYLEVNGIPWRHYFGPNGPRSPPSLYMWPAEYVGDKHKIQSRQGYWSCTGSIKNCQSQEPITFELEVISTAPKAFIIPNFLSEFEADQIIKYADPKLGNSMVGNKDGGGARASDTRTSKNAWVSRETSFVTESLFLRAADILQIDEIQLRSTTNAEDMQVVHYLVGQRYDSHHDWGVSGYAESRYITLLLYLTNQEGPDAGGETSFPKAAGGKGIKVHPGKGSAVLFYNLLEDGNGDDLALHAALPVVYGEKWLANFWVWDPKRK